jgi:hypothetical protein
MLFSRAGRDDADDFFAMTVLPICVHYQEHGGNLGLHLSRANRMPPLFPYFVHMVQAHETALVFEDQCRHFE